MTYNPSADLQHLDLGMARRAHIMIDFLFPAVLSGPSVYTNVIFSSFKMLNASDTCALVSPSETDGLWVRGCWSKPTCELGFDGWKDCWLESVRTEVNRGITCWSNRVEGHEQLSTPGPTATARVPPGRFGNFQTEKWNGCWIFTLLLFVVLICTQFVTGYIFPGFKWNFRQ